MGIPENRLLFLIKTIVYIKKGSQFLESLNFVILLDA